MLRRHTMADAAGVAGLAPKIFKRIMQARPDPRGRARRIPRPPHTARATALLSAVRRRVGASSSATPTRPPPHARGARLDPLPQTLLNIECFEDESVSVSDLAEQIQGAVSTLSPAGAPRPPCGRRMHVRGARVGCPACPASTCPTWVYLAMNTSERRLTHMYST